MSRKQLLQSAIDFISSLNEKNCSTHKDSRLDFRSAIFHKERNKGEDNKKDTGD